jgi:probable rRNA maturation factor
MTDDEPGGKGEAGTTASQLSRATNLEIIDPERRLEPSPTRWLRNSVAGALEALGVAGDLRIRIVGDETMSEAHLRYGGEPGTTDVLTFDLAEPTTAAGPPALDTDILICFDMAARQAAACGHSPEHELLLYIIHGVLHCLGYDDHSESASAAMHRREDEILTAIGIGPVYSAPGAPTLPERKSS